MTKQDKLLELDSLVLDRQLALLRSGDTELLSDLTPTINYLRNNSVLSEKPKSTIEEDTAKRVKEAQARRKKGESI